MTIKQQLNEWVKGNSIHNKDRDECCPDFSCCKPEYLASIEEREAFRQGNEDVRAAMLATFLGRLISGEFPGKEIHMIGDPTSYQDPQ